MIKQNPIYFSGLNGIRAIAALGVVVHHITGNLAKFNLNPNVLGTNLDGTPKGYLLGGHGVTMFFVLSGFLITYLLLKEAKLGQINIKKFYYRRLLRIWPLYYTYILLCIIAMLYYGEAFSSKQLNYYLFFTANIPFIYGFTIELLNHYWSLGVEEQFYFFWPWLVKKSKNYLLKVLIALVIILVAVRWIIHFYTPNTILETILHVTRFHCMMIGAIGAILLESNNLLFIKFFDNKIAQLIAWIILFTVIINQFHIASIIDVEIISIVALAIIVGQINIKNRIINLELKVLNFLGKISYGIYVIHILIIYLFSKIYTSISISNNLNYLIIYTSIILLTILFSWLSFEYFEKYFLRFKKKFEIIKSSNSK